MVFCPMCGKELGDEARFCPMCGFDTSGPATGDRYGGAGYQNNDPRYGDNQNKSMGGTLTIIFVLGIIWVIGQIVGAFILAATFSYLEEMGLFDTGVYSIYGIFSLEEYRAYLIISTIFGILSAICALICCGYIYKLENHKRACTLCLVGSIFALCGGGWAGIIGIVFYFLMKKEKGKFSS